MNPDISVIVCTLNRADSLRETIHRLWEQTLSKDAYEIVIVDNGSADRTSAVVEECRDSSPVTMTYIIEKEIGVSKARNLGIRTARGPIVAFIDDDAQADSFWLARIVDTFQTVKKADAVGGPVRPIFTRPLPPWIPRRLISYLSIVDYGSKVTLLTYPRYPFGTSMAFRKTVFHKIGFFDPSFGRFGSGSFRTGEETDLFLRIERAGGVIVYHPKIEVFHTVPPERITPDWFYEQAHWIGHAFCGMDRKSRGLLFVKGKGLFYLSVLPLTRLLYYTARRLPVKRSQVYLKCVLRHCKGYLHAIKEGP